MKTNCLSIMMMMTHISCRNLLQSLRLKGYFATLSDEAFCATLLVAQKKRKFHDFARP